MTRLIWYSIFATIFILLHSIIKPILDCGMWLALGYVILVIIFEEEKNYNISKEKLDL